MKFLLLIVVLVILYKCSNSNDDYKSRFVASCVKNASKSVCECGYGKLEKHYSIEGMKKLDASKQLPSDFAQVMVKAVEECS